MTDDLVNHPPHYTSHPSGVECITITRWMGFNLGNALKYIWRADLKGNAIKDLEKAIWYLNDEIERRTTSQAARTGSAITAGRAADTSQAKQSASTSDG